MTAASFMSIMCFIFYQNKSGGGSYEAPSETARIQGPSRMPDGATRRYRHKQLLV